ncbi:MAG: MFS transporter [Saprospiraceae bacterium]|nr:MFS transporter [Saprospiraceae bacterium]
MRAARWAVSSVFFTNGVLYATYVSRIPDIQISYDLDYRGVGFVLLTGALGSLFAMPFTGGLIGRWGSKPVTLVASFSFCLSVALFMLSPTVIILSIVFFLKGIVAGITDVAMNAQAVLVERNARRPIMSTFHGIFSLGMFVGAGAGTIFISQHVSVLHHLFIMAVAGFLFVISMSRHLIKDDLDVSPEKIKNAKYFNFPSLALVGIGIISFCAMLAEGAMADWSTNFMREVIEASPSLAPVGLSAFSLAMLAGRLIGDQARMYFGDQRLINACSIISLAGLLFIIVGFSAGLAILGFFLAGLGLSVIVPIVYSKAGNTPGIDPGTGISMVTTIGYSGFIVGPPVIGYLADWKGLQIAYLFVLLLLLVMFFLNLRVQKKLRPEHIKKHG